MKYCKKCGNIFEQGVSKCTECRKSVLSEEKPDKDFPIVAIRTSGFERQRICATLDDEGITYSTRIAKKQISENAVKGTSNAYYDILVPYGIYKKTIDILLGINAEVKAEAVLLADEQKDDVQESSFDNDDYYSTKNRIVRVVSVILFLALVTGVVLGVDAIMALIKQYFF